VKLELDIARMRRDLAEKDNIIEEKAEEMYMLNEKLEQQVRNVYVERKVRTTDRKCIC
jgi:hypothetical protein